VLSALFLPPLFHSRLFGHSRCPEYALSKTARNLLVSLPQILPELETDADDLDEAESQAYLKECAELLYDLESDDGNILNKKPVFPNRNFID
jgi:hypothetical protein